MIRAFVAVNLSVPVLRRISEVQRALRERAAADGWDVKWIAPPNLHVQLRYLGEINSALPAVLEEVLGRKVEGLPPFPLRARGLRTLSAEGLQDRLVVDLEDPEGGLARLDAAVSEQLEEVGFRSNPGGAAPHVVVARVRSPGATPLVALASEAAAADFGESLVAEVVAYRSDVAASGDEFRDLFRTRLGGERRPPATTRSSPPPPPEAPVATPEDRKSVV